MINVYIAGPLFNEAEIAQRTREGAIVKGILSRAVKEKRIDDWKVFNPIETPINFKVTKPTAAMIFDADREAIHETTHFFFDLSNLDTGTFVELGMAIELYRHNREAAAVGSENPIHIYPVFSDIRIPAAGEYEGIHVPTGNNQFVVGALEYYGIQIYSTFSDAAAQFSLDVVHQAQ